MSKKQYPPTVHNSYLLDPRNKPILERKKARLYAFEYPPVKSGALIFGLPLLAIVSLFLLSLGSGKLDEHKREDTYMRLGICLIFSPVPTSFLLLAIRNRRRRKRLERDGQLLPGKNTHIKQTPLRGPGCIVEIRYTFSTQEGITKAGKNSAFRYPEPKEPLPHANQQVAVCYANEHLYTAL
jgi:hypothetical protein